MSECIRGKRHRHSWEVRVVSRASYQALQPYFFLDIKFYLSFIQYGRKLGTVLNAISKYM